MEQPDTKKPRTRRKPAPAAQATLDETLDAEAAELGLRRPEPQQPEPLADGEPVATEPLTPQESHPDAADEAETSGLVEVGTTVATVEADLAAPAGGMTWTREQAELVKRTVAKGSSDDELRLFMHVCQRTGLDPFAKQIYFIKRWDADTQGMVFQPQVAIDGLRLIAERTGQYLGRKGPQWCGDDGAWRDVWTDKAAPAAARVEVLREGREPTVAVALMHEYRQTKKDGSPTRMWGDKGMPVHMIGKVAEALALRAAFPQELGDVYSFEELPAPTAQGPDADDEPIDAEAVEEEPGDKVTVAQVDELRAELKMLEPQPSWTEDAVIQAASRSFKRRIIQLADLRESEWASIMVAAREARS